MTLRMMMHGTGILAMLVGVGCGSAGTDEEEGSAAASLVTRGQGGASGYSGAWGAGGRAGGDGSAVTHPGGAGGGGQAGHAGRARHRPL